MKVSILFLFFSSFGFGQHLDDSSSLVLMKEIVAVLASDSLLGREVGSVSEQKSLDFISSQFKKNSNKKLKTQSFEFEYSTSKIESKNGYCFVNNHQKETILIGAHYDHIGLGGPLSMSFKTDAIHNGADDNASGVGLLIALSEKLITQKSPKYNYLIVFYSAHEVGLFGSSAFYSFVEKRKRKFKKIKLVVNFDMVGRFDNRSKKLKCMTSSAIQPLLQNQKSNDVVLNITEEEKLKNLDTRIFVQNGIDCVNFTTGMHDDYHATSDDVQYINFEGMLQIENFVFDFLRAF